MKKSGFFALISRMRYINRWGLMRSSIEENVQEHSHMVAVLAHALGLIAREIFKKDVSAERLAVLALYHDASEILTGDLPTPVKYINPEIKAAYKSVEQLSAEKLLGLIPEELRESYTYPLLGEYTEDNSYELKLLKAADSLSAYIKCIEERKAGNLEFISAETQSLEKIRAMGLEEAEYFIEKFIPAFELNLDELWDGEKK